jgi:hypothetical protein
LLVKVIKGQGTVSVVSGERPLSFPRMSTAETE